MGNIVFDARNIHTGGGKTLLLDLMSAATKNDEKEFLFLLDYRFDSSQITTQNNVKFIKAANLLDSSLLLYKSLRSKGMKKKYSTIVHLNNRPPFFRPSQKTILYLQNRYCVDNFPLRGFSLKSKIRIYLERIFLSLFASHVDLAIVQSQTMKELLRKRGFKDSKIEVFPFLSLNSKAREKTDCSPADNSTKFLYVASGEPHKNHLKLIEAWTILKEEGLDLDLTLTLPKGDKLRQKIETIKQKKGLNISFSLQLKKEEMSELYQKNHALIFPSLMETIGLPLLEAEQFQLPIIASELDYVRDFVTPHQTFDPNSALSISRAIKRFQNKSSQPISVGTPEDFIASL